MVQAGTGTRQIGRFDIYYDEQTMMLDHYDWSLIPIDAAHCPLDSDVETYINELKEILDQKYQRVLCTLPKKIPHTARNRITELGAFVSDIMKENCNVDVFLLNPGALRTYGIGPDVTVEALVQGYPYASDIYGVRVTVGQFTRMMTYMLNKVDYYDLASSMMQVSGNVKIIFDRGKGEIISLTISGETKDDDLLLTVGMGRYMYNGVESYFGISQDEIAQNGKTRIVAVNDRELIETALEDGHYRLDFSTDRITVI